MAGKNQPARSDNRPCFTRGDAYISSRFRGFKVQRFSAGVSGSKMSKGKEKHTAQSEPVQKADKGAPAPGAEAAPAAATPAAAGAPGALETLQDQLLRLRADFDNFRRRALREKGEIYEQANSELMLELLPVLDHFQLGLQSAAAHAVDQAVQQGMQLIYDQLIGALAKFGLSPYNTENQPFDPATAEAVNCMPSDAVPEGVVLNQVRCGYMLKGRLLRPAQVIVSSGPPGKTPEAAPGPVSREGV
jgi:molecular chaperone GrpE